MGPSLTASLLTTSLPRVTDQLVQRPHLNARLSEWAPLTVVRGMRGSGKTTTVASWLEHQQAELTVVWVTAGPSIGELQSFEDYLSGSLRRAGLLQSESFVRSGLVELGAALLAESSDRRFVLVIDNFGQIRDRRVLTELTNLVERHRNFHLVVCCEGFHPIESLFADKTRVNVIEIRELLFGGDEIVELASTMGLTLDHAEAEQLRRAVGGCISMVRMALDSSEGLTVLPAVVEDFVRTQLLADFEDEALMEHLMRFSLTELCTWPLFRDLCGEMDPRSAIEALEATGLVTRADRGGEVLFTMPKPITEMLRSRYTSSAPERALEFHRRLGRWFAAQSDEKYVSFAFHHAVAGRDWELTDQLWSEDIVTMIRQDVALMSRTLNAIPADVLATRPSMQVLSDISRVAMLDSDADGRRATLRAFADDCSRLVKQQWDSMPLNELLILATGYLIELRLLGRLLDSVAFADRVNARVTALTATERVNKSRFAWFLVHSGITYTLLNDETNAVRAYRRAWEYATGAGADFIQAQAASNLALIYAVGGDTARAREWLGRFASFDISDWPGSYLVGIGAHVAAGLLALARLDDDGVRLELEYLGNGSPVLELWPFIAYLYAERALHCGKAAEALAHLDQMQATNSEDDQANKGATGALMARARADLLIALGRGEKANQLVRSKGAGKPWSRVPAARIRLLGDQGTSAPGVNPLIWDPATSVGDRLEMLLLGAVESLRHDDSPTAQRLVNQAVNLYKETGSMRQFATIAAAEREQLLELADQDLDPDDLAILARQAPVNPDRLVFVELSEHEQHVLEALASTASRQVIADSLFVSVNTVKTQLASIYQKLGSSTRAETLVKAREHELLPPGEP